MPHAKAAKVAKEEENLKKNFFSFATFAAFA